MKKWIYSNGVYRLHSSTYDRGIKPLLQFTNNKNDSNCFHYVSHLLNVEDDCIRCDSIEEAKEEFENIILDYYEEQAKYYDDLVNQFTED